MPDGFQYLPASERVAQSVEHVTFNHGVLGSSPSALTKSIKHLGENPPHRPKCVCLQYVGKRITASGNAWARCNCLNNSGVAAARPKP